MLEDRTILRSSTPTKWGVVPTEPASDAQVGATFDRKCLNLATNVAPDAEHELRLRRVGGVWVGWIREYRPLRHPVNLRLTQAGNQIVSTLLRG